MKHPLPSERKHEARTMHGDSNIENEGAKVTRRNAGNLEETAQFFSFEMIFKGKMAKEVNHHTFPSRNKGKEN